MRGGNTLMFLGLLGVGWLGLQWLREANRVANATQQAVQQQLEQNPYHAAPEGAPPVAPAPAASSGYTDAHPAVVGTALGFGYRYKDDPYFHE